MATSDDDQSSINLSLRLRRGSSDSRDSFYMDLDRGIDSDIEMNEPTTQGREAHPRDAGGEEEAVLSSGDCSTESYLEGEYPGSNKNDWVEPPDSPSEGQQLLSSSSSKPTILQRSETFSGGPNDDSLADVNSSTAVSPNNNEIILNNAEPAARGSEDSGLGTAITHPNNTPQRKRPTQLALDLHVQHIPRSNSSSFAESCNSLTPAARDDVFLEKGRCSIPQRTNCDSSGSYSDSILDLQNNGPSDCDALVIMLSGVYGKLVIIMGICFPLAEVISHRIPISYYEAFYLYLYSGSILFLCYVYLFLLRSQPITSNTSPSKKGYLHKLLKKFLRQNLERSNSVKRKVDDAAHCGSFYLRLGAVAFGIGCMIYSGLEFGQFFELDTESSCYNVMYGITPTAHMIFTFIQLYFIFLNSTMAINKYKSVARFGLMHMIASNLCVWLRVLVQETKHQIVRLINETNETKFIPSFMLENPEYHHNHPELRKDDSTHDSSHHSNVYKRSLDDTIYISHECRRSNIMGQLVQDASPFLFPCTIEYSLICAAILYIMWKNTGRFSSCATGSDHTSVHSSISRHHYHVDCAKANKGLFTGILVLVLSIICLIIFFVLINKPQYKDLAVLEAHIAELILYCLTTLALIVALFQVRTLKFNANRNMELDNILLLVAQSGLYLFTMFSIIGGYFTMEENTILVLLTALACLIQSTLQTCFILDASRRYARNGQQVREKPGREMVTFLLVCNFAMWAINTLETRRADSNPVQMHFYGFWAWTIITHVTTPLTIFFRFHSTVCLCDIWKRTYKAKPEFV